jgi:type I restriction enzyme S subunit
MPNNWKTYKLGELCTNITSGGTPNTRNLEYYNGNIPWLKTQEVNFNKIYDTETKITELGLKNSSAKIIPKNNIIIAMYGATAGRLAINKIPLSTNQACCNLTVNHYKADYRYIYYNLFSRFDRIADMAIGGAQQNLNSGMIKNLDIQLPPLQEQQSIASILSAIDDKIENNLAINKTLEEMAMALYKHWFVDFGPFQDGEFVESELGLIPKGWKVKRLDEIAYKRAESYNFKGKEKVVFVNTGDVLEGSFMHNNYMDVEDLPGQAKKAIYPEDILYSEIRPGNKRFAYVDFDSHYYVVSTKFMVIRNNDLVNNRLLYRILTREETIAEFQNIAESRSGTFPQITFDAIGHIQFALPSIDLQNEFQSIVGNWEEMQSNNLKENKSLTQLRDTLLPKLISGEVRLKEFREKI